MFITFFFMLRQHGLNVSLNEWLTLNEAMVKGLHHSSLSGFYNLCRTILIKSETDFDRFDQVFMECFKDVPFHGEVPEEMREWLEKPKDEFERDLRQLIPDDYRAEDIESVLKRMEERLKEQTEEHNGGSYWIGTQGMTAYGNGGWSPGGIRIGGTSKYHTAMMVAGERKYRDFRRDTTLGIRQFQMAFRTLRQYSIQKVDNEKVLDVDATIHKTCDNAGMLQVEYTNPRKNAIKVLLLMDAGGSMDYYAELCNQLFQAATKNNHFKELHTYYFHNIFHGEVYKTPRQDFKDYISLEWIFQNFDSSYKVIIVGDASMEPEELTDNRYFWKSDNNSLSGWDWIRRFERTYPHLIWLNPESLPRTDSYLTRTHIQIASAVKMYELTTDGLEQGMKQLMARR